MRLVEASVESVFLSCPAASLSLGPSPTLPPAAVANAANVELDHRGTLAAAIRRLSPTADEFQKRGQELARVAFPAASAAAAKPTVVVPIGQAVWQPAALKWTAGTEHRTRVQAVIHAVGPNFNETSVDENSLQLVSQAVYRALCLAEANHMRVVALPFISGGAFRGSVSEDEIVRRVWHGLQLFFLDTRVRAGKYVQLVLLFARPNDSIIRNGNNAPTAELQPLIHFQSLASSTPSSGGRTAPVFEASVTLPALPSHLHPPVAFPRSAAPYVDVGASLFEEVGAISLARRMPGESPSLDGLLKQAEVLLKFLEDNDANMRPVALVVLQCWLYRT